MFMQLRGLSMMLALCLVSLLAHAATEAGRVLFVVGEAQLLRNTQPVALTRGLGVQVGDVITTGESGRLQLKMADKARIALRPNSRLVVEDYQLEAPGAATPAAVQGGGERSFLRLLRGGLRTLTGSIGKDDEAAYELRTPVATLGIRGTMYTAVLCAQDCLIKSVDGDELLDDGLYVEVSAGSVVVRNSAGVLQIGAGEALHVASDDTPPKQLQDAPPILRDDGPASRRPAGRNGAGGAVYSGYQDPTDEQGGASQQGAESDAADGQQDGGLPGAGQSGSGQTPQQQLAGRDASGNLLVLGNGKVEVGPAVVSPARLSFSAGPLGAAAGFASLSGMLERNAAQAVVAFSGPHPGSAGNASYRIADNSTFDQGFDPETRLRWGRWSDGVADIDLPEGRSADQDLRSQSLHWVARDGEQAVVLPQTGSASYALVGNTDPSNSSGQVGFLGSAKLEVDFTAQQLNHELSLSVAEQRWDASGTADLAAGNIPAGGFAGNYTTVQVNGVAGGDGVFSGVFSSEQVQLEGMTDPLPAGAGLSYTLIGPDGAVDTVSGSAIFGAPQ